MSYDAFTCVQGRIVAVRVPARRGGGGGAHYEVTRQFLPPPAPDFIGLYVDNAGSGQNFIVFPPMPGSTTEWRMISRVESDGMISDNRIFILGDRQPCAT